MAEFSGLGKLLMIGGQSFLWWVLSCSLATRCHFSVDCPAISSCNENNSVSISRL